MSLAAVLKQENDWRKMFNKEPLRRPRTPEECKPLFGMLAGMLSPENLCCDGELPYRQVQAKARRLNKAWMELEEIFGREVDESETYRW